MATITKYKGRQSTHL